MRIGLFSNGLMPQLILGSAGGSAGPEASKEAAAGSFHFPSLSPDLLTAAHNVTDVSRIFQPGQAPRQDFSQWQLRAYQQEMLAGLERDYRDGKGPWFGLASPMQTGKSYLIAPAIQLLRQYLGDDARFIVLSSSRAITDQVVGDLLGGMPAGAVGRFDKDHKEIQSVTVANYLSLLRHLKNFPTDRPTVLINDEAYFTQSPSFRKIFKYFGVGDVLREGKRSVVKPRAGRGLVLGLSGTGSGLVDYHISGQLSLFDAIDQGWIRHMIGERHRPSIEPVRRDAQFEQMVWWPETKASADYLVQVYLDKIHGKYDRPLIFVPKIKHAELMRDALRRAGIPRQQVHTVFSGPNRDDANQAALKMWDEQGGCLISVRMLSRGFRAGRSQAVFHTYQTSSPELYAQRTGRAWAGTPGMEQDDLYVLEVSWDGSASFANLARLLGLVDYPEERFETRKHKKRIGSRLEQKEQKSKMRLRIKSGEVSSLFLNVPVVGSWRTAFAAIVKQVDSLEALHEETAIPMDVLAAYALGALPLELDHVRRFRKYIGGIDAALELWINTWRHVAMEAVEGEATLSGEFMSELRYWLSEEQDLHDRAKALEAVLRRHFKSDALYNENMQSLIADIRRYVSAVPKELSDVEIRALIDETRDSFLDECSDRERLVFCKRFLATTPATLTSLAQDLGISANRVSQTYRRVEHKYRHFFRVQCRLDKHAGENSNGIIPLSLVRLSAQAIKVLRKGHIGTLGELACHTEWALRARNKLSAQLVTEVQTVLKRFGLSLSMDPDAIAAHYERSVVEVPKSIAKKVELQQKLRESVPILIRSVYELDLSTKLDNLFSSMGIRSLGELVCFSESELLGFKSFGSKALEETEEILATLGLEIGVDPHDLAEAYQQAKQPLPSLILKRFREIEPRAKRIAEQQNGPTMLAEQDWPRRLQGHIAQLDLSATAEKCLARYNQIHIIADLVLYTEDELLRLKGSTREMVQEVVDRLWSVGLPLGMDPRELVILFGGSSRQALVSMGMGGKFLSHWDGLRQIEDVGNESKPTQIDVPSDEAWRTAFSGLMQNVEDLETLHQETGIPMDVLKGYERGVLPVELEHVRCLRVHLGGIDRALFLWFQGWSQLVTSETHMWKGLVRDLNVWHSDPSTAEQRAEALEGILRKHIAIEESYDENVRNLIVGLREYPTPVSWETSDRELVHLIDEKSAQFLGGESKKNRDIFRSIYKAVAPVDKKQLAEQYRLSTSRLDIIIGQQRSRFIEFLKRHLYIQTLSSSSDVMTVPLHEKVFSKRMVDLLMHHGIRTLGELACCKAAWLQTLQGFGPKSIQEIIELLGHFGLALDTEAKVIAERYKDAGHPVPEIVQQAISEAERAAKAPPREQSYMGSVNILGLSQWSATALAVKHIVTIGELACYLEWELSSASGFNPQTIAEIQNCFEKTGHSMGMDPFEVSSVFLRHYKPVPSGLIKIMHKRVGQQRYDPSPFEEALTLVSSDLAEPAIKDQLSSLWDLLVKLKAAQDELNEAAVVLNLPIEALILSRSLLRRLQDRYIMRLADIVCYTQADLEAIMGVTHASAMMITAALQRFDLPLGMNPSEVYLCLRPDSARDLNVFGRDKEKLAFELLKEMQGLDSEKASKVAEEVRPNSLNDASRAKTHRRPWSEQATKDDLDRIMREFGISSLEELRERLKKS